MPTEQMLRATLPDEAFRQVTLDMDAEAALELIQQQLAGLSVVETARGYKIRDTGGHVVAVVSEYERGPDEAGIRLAYRVGPSPSHASVRRGRRIFEILEPHIW